jgi:predicted PurR-regulated permease PerM
MSAKHKLNTTATLGSLALAAIVGGMTGVVVAVVLLAIAVESGEIRL